MKKKIKDFETLIEECGKAAGTLKGKLGTLVTHKADLNGPRYKGKFVTIELITNLTILKYQIEEILEKGGKDEPKKLGG